MKYFVIKEITAISRQSWSYQVSTMRKNIFLSPLESVETCLYKSEKVFLCCPTGHFPLLSRCEKVFHKISGGRVSLLAHGLNTSTPTAPTVFSIILDTYNPQPLPIRLKEP